MGLLQGPHQIKKNNPNSKGTNTLNYFKLVKSVIKFENRQISCFDIYLKKTRNKSHSIKM